MDGYAGSGTRPLKEWLSAIFLVMVVLCSFSVFPLAAGCLERGPSRSATSPVLSPPPQNIPAGSIELVFFHPVPGCDSCEQVGLLANETVTTYFSREIASGKIAFYDVNLNLPENRDWADRYGAYNESLWIGEYDETGFHATEILDIWYYAYNREEFMKYLKGVLDRKLAGAG